MYLGALSPRMMITGARPNFILYRPPVTQKPGGPILPGPMPVWNPPQDPTAGGACTPNSVGAPGWYCVNGKWQAVGDANPLYLPDIKPVGPVYGGTATSGSSPVPTGFPRNQIFVSSDGSFWQWSTSQLVWMNVGTPYNTGASATPPAPPPSPSGGSTAAPAGTTAPAPVNVNIASAPSLYQEIFDWLKNETTLFGMEIPNWVIGGGVGLFAFKTAYGGKR